MASQHTATRSPIDPARNECHCFPPPWADDAGGGLKRNSVDREVHTTAGREAGGTISLNVSKQRWWETREPRIRRTYGRQMRGILKSLSNVSRALVRV